MDDRPDPIELLWASLLSRDPDRVKKAFFELPTEEQQAVQAHLERMVREPGWHPEQRLSAEAALAILAE